MIHCGCDWCIIKIVLVINLCKNKIVSDISVIMKNVVKNIIFVLFFLDHVGAVQRSHYWLMIGFEPSDVSLDWNWIYKNLTWVIWFEWQNLEEISILEI